MSDAKTLTAEEIEQCGHGIRWWLNHWIGQPPLPRPNESFNKIVSQAKRVPELEDRLATAKAYEEDHCALHKGREAELKAECERLAGLYNGEAQVAAETEASLTAERDRYRKVAELARESQREAQWYRDGSVGRCPTRESHEIDDDLRAALAAVGMKVEE